MIIRRWLCRRRTATSSDPSRLDTSRTPCRPCRCSSPYTHTIHPTPTPYTLHPHHTPYTHTIHPIPTCRPCRCRLFLQPLARTFATSCKKKCSLAMYVYSCTPCYPCRCMLFLEPLARTFATPCKNTGVAKTLALLPCIFTLACRKEEHCRTALAPYQPAHPSRSNPLLG